MKSVKVHWCYINNFGDALNPYLIEKLSGLRVKYCNYTTPDYLKEIKLFVKSILKFSFYDFNRLKGPDKKSPIVLGVGSLLDRSQQNFLVWGAGYMNNFERAKGGSLFAIRGKYSAEKLYREGFKYCNVWGDPALLLPLLFLPNKSEIIHQVGIVPHVKDYTFFKEKYSESAYIINLETNDVEKVIDQICSCKYILSTSLHGLIVAHAYNIPAIWIQHNDINTDGIKFYDYFSSVDIKIYDGFRDYQKAFDNPNEFFYKIETLTLPRKDVKNIQISLLNVAPFPILDKYNSLCII